MEQYIDDFLIIREVLAQKIDESVNVFLTEMWDSLSIYTIPKDIKKIIINELSDEFPEFPIDYLPKINILKCGNSFEVYTQYYFNNDEYLNYLGTITLDDMIYDLYCKESWDVLYPYIFYARYGHRTDMVDKGDMIAKDEYLKGKITALSMAYEFALEQGYLKSN